LKWMKTGIW